MVVDNQKPSRQQSCHHWGHRWLSVDDNIRRQQWGQSVGRNQDDRPTTGQWQAIALGCYLYASAWRCQVSQRRTVSRHSHLVLMLYILMSHRNPWQTITQYTSVPSDCASRPSAATMRILCNTQNNHPFRHNRRRRNTTMYAAAGDAGAFNMTCHC